MENSAPSLPLCEKRSAGVGMPAPASADYLFDMLKALERLAAGDDRAFLRYLIAMATIEAYRLKDFPAASTPAPSE
ncbi:MAG: hypothetical protein AAGF19_09465 [Pseudomonadota bacterium]